MATYVITLGYDERFAVRFLLRHAVSEDDVILTVLPSSFRSDEKSVAAFNSLRKLVEWVEPVELDLEKPVASVAYLSSLIGEKSRGEVQACLSGGMRSVVVITLLALQNLIRETSKIVWIEIDFENLSGHIRIPLNAFMIPRNERFLRILEVLVGGDLGRRSIRHLGERTGLPLATAHREVKKMIKMGLLTAKLELTEFGRAYFLLNSTQSTRTSDSS